MPDVQTLRPTSTVAAGGWTAISSGSLHAATSDNSDSTFAQGEDLGTGGGATQTGEMRLGVGNHTPPADHERHGVRWRFRGRRAGGSGGLRFTSRWVIGSTEGAAQNRSVTTAAIADYNGAYLLTPPPSGTLSASYRVFVARFNAGEGIGVFLAPDIMEVYVDIDSRAKPTFTPDVTDASGASVSGGTITDTNIARLLFGAVARDGLAARSWTVEVEDTGTNEIVYSDSGVGEPPAELTTSSLDNGSYQARFQAFTTIRQNSPFASDVETVNFAVDFTPPVPPELDITPVVSPPAVDVCWTEPTPGAVEWDNTEAVVTEIRRTDCNGMQTIYVAVGFEGCHLDRFMSLSTQGVYCGEIDHDCEVCYEARQWGRVDGVIVSTDWTDPECELALANPSPGDDWLRGAASGDMAICPDRTYGRVRPFGAFQPIGGGLPIVTSGTPGGRNYTLEWYVTSEADLVLLESILDQPLNYYQPDDQADLWMAPDPQSVEVVKVDRIRQVTVSFVATGPPPQPDPADIVPESEPPTSP